MKNSLSKSEIEKQLLQITHQFLTELAAERAKLAITLDAELEQDLGLGSLEKSELFRRIEKNFAITLPEKILITAKTLNDFVVPIQEAKPAKKTTATIYAPLETINIDLSSAETLVDVLKKYADLTPDRPHIYLQDDEGKEEIIHYGKLLENAAMVAKGLLARGLKLGETVAIMLPTCDDFFYAFFGVLLAGGVPVPIYPPFRPEQIEEYAKREAFILRNAEVRILITFQRAETLSKLLRTFIPSLIDVATVTELKAQKGELPEINLTSTDGALIQYTSGSTGNPKGVFLTHANLLANIRTYGKGVGVRPTDVIVSWLPLYHDMGLIGTWFGSLYHGTPVVIMSPLNFLSKPENWLWKIHYHRGTISGGPNFAFEMCIKKIDEKDLEGLDLSSWRLAFNGAEAIYPNTLEKFAKKFARYGFNSKAIFPVYGLAESTVALTFPKPGEHWHIDKVAREPLEREGKAIPFISTSKNSLEFVSCGQALPGHEIRIVDEKNKPLPERRVGNLQFRGPSSMQGYYRNPKATEAVYHDGWWDSGDLAYIADGEVYITGRKKDVIIKAGRNIYPPEIEEVTSQVQGVRKGCVVAFGAKDPKQGTERFIIVAETYEKDPATRQKITNNIVDKIVTVLGIPPDQVILAPPRAIPKTSSGKLRRSSALDLFLHGKLEKPKVPVWQQLTKLFVIGRTKQTWRWLRKIAKIFYTSYVWILLMITVLPLWLISYFLSRKKLQNVVQLWAKLILKLVGMSVKLSGEENLKIYPIIYTANHASYVDSIVLISTLPSDTLFVVKEELTKVPIIGRFIKKLGHLTVNRLDFTQSLADTQLIQNALQQNHSVLIFPEGTFTYATGLRPFKLGAFKLAVETATPICPIALQGTRIILRNGTQLLRPGKIKVHILPLAIPQNKEWNEVIRLRNIAHSEIAKHCGEPTLDLIRAGFEYEKNR